jgi:Uma2 family endonuclease
MADISAPSGSALPASGVPMPIGSTSSGNSHCEEKSPPVIRFIPGDVTAEICIPSSAHSLNGFRNWALSEDFPDRGRFTYAADELIIDMSPEIFESHNFPKSEITSVLYRHAKERHLGRVCSDRCLFSNEAAGISTEPDATFVRYSSFIAGRCRIVRGARPGVCDELIGSPDWVLEIISPSSVRKDTKLLYQGYFRAGVGEYWLIDVRHEDIDFQLFIPGEDAYVAVEPHEGWLASATFGCSFRLTREKDEDGLWLYTLHVRENS